MKTILDQIITNFPSETWLREQRNMEADDEATAYVVSAATPPVERVPLTLIPTQVAVDDEDECGPSVLLSRWHYAHARSAESGSAAADAVTS